MAEIFRTGGSLAWDSAWQVTLFIIIGGAASVLWARRPAQAHRVLLLAMLGGLLTPPLGQAVRRLGWGLLATRPATVNGAGRGEPPAPGPRPASRPSAPIRSPRTGLAPPVAEAIGVRTAHPVAGPARPAPASWRVIAMRAWVILGGLAAVRLFGALALGRRVVARARPLVDETIRDAAEAARRGLELGVTPEIRVSDRVRCPVIWCWGRRPVLLVPEAVLRGPAPADWTAVLVHELAHWKRRDHLSGLVAEILACVLPWHPLAWWARARLGRLSERACDDWVLAGGRSAPDYAETLLGLAPQRRLAAALTAAVSSRADLVGRIRRILDDHLPRPEAGRAWTGLAIAATALVVAATALAQARPAGDGPPASKAGQGAIQEKGKDRQTERHSARGVVLGPDGTPAAGAFVRWIARRNLALSSVAMPIEAAMRSGNLDQEMTLAEGRTDAEGRFAFEADFDPAASIVLTQLVVRAPGAGLLGRTVLGDEAELRLRLAPEVEIRGQILTPAGQPAAGVRVVLQHFQSGAIEQRPGEPEILGVGSIPKDEDLPDYWPRPRVTDADGRFTLGGVPRGVFASLVLTHPDFAVGEVTATTGQKTSKLMEAFGIAPVGPEFTHALELARPVEGVVTAADTGQPLPGLPVEMIPMRKSGGHTFYGRTDAQGRYRISGHQANLYFTQVHPPADSGYLSLQDRHQGWPAGASSLVVNFKLPRGRLLRGQVRDGATGRPVAGAAVVYQPKSGNPHNRDEYDLRGPTLADADGRFVLTVLPGEGYVAVEAPDPGYIRVPLERGHLGRITAYPQGFTAVDVPEKGDPAAAVVVLHKGVTLEARAIGPDGRVVPHVVASCTGIDARLIDRWDYGQTFADGVFRLPGADPEKTYRVFFIEPDRRLGAIADLKHDPGKPAEVHLQPTASVRGSLVDPGGRPVAVAQVYPLIVLTQRGGELVPSDLLSDNDTARYYGKILGGDHMLAYSSRGQPDERGGFLLDNLIPGAQFYVVAVSGDQETSQAVSALEPGEVRDLGAIQLKERER